MEPQGLGSVQPHRKALGHFQVYKLGGYLSRGGVSFGWSRMSGWNIPSKDLGTGRLWARPGRLGEGLTAPRGHLHREGGEVRL